MVRTSALAATVKVFLTILSSRIVKHDKQLEAKGQTNIYRLGLFLEALHKAEDAVRSHMEDSTPEALEALKKALKKHFTPDFPPAKAVVKMVDEFLANGKLPKLAAIVAKFEMTASKQTEITELLRDAVDEEAGRKELDAAKVKLHTVLRGMEAPDAIYLFLKAMKQANVSVGQALAFISRI